MSNPIEDDGAVWVEEVAHAIVLDHLSADAIEYLAVAETVEEDYDGDEDDIRLVHKAVVAELNRLRENYDND